MATNEYQISSSGVPKQLPRGIPDDVAQLTLPADVVVQDPYAFTVRAIAPEQLSFAGAEIVEVTSVLVEVADKPELVQVRTHWK